MHSSENSIGSVRETASSRFAIELFPDHSKGTMRAWMLSPRSLLVSLCMNADDAQTHGVGAFSGLSSSSHGFGKKKPWPQSRLRE